MRHVPDLRQIAIRWEKHNGTGAPPPARAHFVLRTHGQKLCWRTGPDCAGCPVADCRALASSGKTDAVSRW